MAVQDWSSTASANTSVGGLTTDGNIQTVNNIDGMFRGMMADIRTGIDAGQFRYVGYAEKSGNYTAMVSDRDKVLRFTATATLTLSAAATLGAGWSVTVYAVAGLTIDPTGSEQINGSATAMDVTQGTTVTIMCTGTDFRAFESIGLRSGSNANGDWVRWTDGTQICYRFTSSITTVAAGTASATLTWPAAFSGSNPKVTTSVVTTNPLRFNAAASGGLTTVTVYVSDSGAGGVGAQASVVGIGRWY